VDCGAKLGESKEKDWEKNIEDWGEDFGKRMGNWGEDFGKQIEKECYGLRHGATIIGLIIGLIIILVGVASLVGISLKFWPMIIVFFGLLVLGGAIYSLVHKRK
jgi:uncharacterized protein YacL